MPMPVKVLCAGIFMILAVMLTATYFHELFQLTGDTVAVSSALAHDTEELLTAFAERSLNLVTYPLVALLLPPLVVAFCVIVLINLVSLAVRSSRYLLASGARQKISNSPEPVKRINYFEENRSEVIGWETASKEDQMYLPPVELRAKIDAENPLGDSIKQLESALQNTILHPRSEWWYIRRRRERIEKKILQCREAYVKFRFDQLTRGDDELLRRIEKEVALLLKK